MKRTNSSTKTQESVKHFNQMVKKMGRPRKNGAHRLEADGLSLADLRKAEIIKALRSPLTQEEFSRMYNVPVTALRAWEQDRKSPSLAWQMWLFLIYKSPDVASKMVKVSKSSLNVSQA